MFSTLLGPRLGTIFKNFHNSPYEKKTFIRKKKSTGLANSSAILCIWWDYKVVVSYELIQPNKPTPGTLPTTIEQFRPENCTENGQKRSKGMIESFAT